MALSKSKSLANGSSGDYWRLTHVTFSRETLELIARIALYASSTVANATNQHLGLVKVYKFTVLKSELSTDIRVLAYDKIKDKSSEVISFDELGRAVTPHAYDPDLDGATDV